jgi:tRNA threonylcarbamoyladenosine biosynthesis protein TsaB
VKILALDTATELCSAALYIDGSIRVREDARPRGSGELILGMIAELLAESAVALAQLDAIAFGRGPGGFTGVRLAVAVAQGLGFAADLPLLPVSELRALARQALMQSGVPPRVLVCQDARMAQVYWSCYEAVGATPGVLRERQPEALDFPADVRLPPDWHGAPVCGAGSGFEAYEGILARPAGLAGLPGAALAPLFGHLRPRAREIAELAAIDGIAAAVAPESAQPVYLREDVAAPSPRN